MFVSNLSFVLLGPDRRQDLSSPVAVGHALRGPHHGGQVQNLRRSQPNAASPLQRSQEHNMRTVRVRQVASSLRERQEAREHVSRGLGQVEVPEADQKKKNKVVGERRDCAGGDAVKDSDLGISRNIVNVGSEKVHGMFLKSGSSLFSALYREM